MHLLVSRQNIVIQIFVYYLEINVSNPAGKDLMRRQSLMSDIDDASFVEYTSTLPEGKFTHHVDSVETIRDNLYFTSLTTPMKRSIQLRPKPIMLNSTSIHL